MAPCWRWEGDDLHLTIRVQPRSASDQIVGVVGDAVKIRLTAPPVEGKANKALTRLVAREFGVAPGRVSVVGGERGRDKHLRIARPRSIPAWLEGIEPGAPE